jgi:hypothetical protein
MTAFPSCYQIRICGNCELKTTCANYDGKIDLDLKLGVLRQQTKEREQNGQT